LHLRNSAPTAAAAAAPAAAAAAPAGMDSFSTVLTHLQVAARPARFFLLHSSSICICAAAAAVVAMAGHGTCRSSLRRQALTAQLLSLRHSRTSSWLLRTSSQGIIPVAAAA
jgi:hypothetical protein